jgi:hypothetical protein
VSHAIVIAAILAFASGCDGSVRPRHYTVEKPVHAEPVAVTPHHATHEHAHGPHPHPRSDHHHHQHPHPHLAAANGHHHPY